MLSRLVFTAIAAMGLSYGAVLPYSFSGSFAFDSDLQFFDLNLNGPGPSTIDVRTFGFGGGTNSLSQTFAPGGFAPSLALYDSLGNLQAQDSQGGTVIGPPPGTCSNSSNIDASVNLCLDSRISFSAQPGAYILVLSEQGNDGPSVLSDGYSLPPGTNQNPGPFVDPFGNQRNANYALDINLDGTAIQEGSAAPEPSTLACCLTAVAALALRVRCGNKERYISR